LQRKFPGDLERKIWVRGREGMSGEQALRVFRAGIEATISYLKRCVGWTHCAWPSLRSYTAYVWSSVVTANLLLIIRCQLD